VRPIYHFPPMPTSWAGLKSFDSSRRKTPPVTSPPVRIIRVMTRRTARRGYTLVEVIIALMVFTTGALALAAGSAVVVREMHASRVRAEAGRLIASRLEIVQSTCPLASSGGETQGSVRSEWTVVPLDSNNVRVAGNVSYVLPRGPRAETYSTIVACR